MKILNSRQETVLNMMDLIQSFLDDRTDIVVLNLGFKNAFDELKPIITNIKTAAQVSSAVTSGITQGKNTSKEDLSQTASRIAGQMFAYAAKTGNVELKAAADFSASDLLRLKDGELAIRCQEIHDQAVAKKDVLADYGVTAAKLADLQTAINEYAQKVTKPRDAITNRKVVKANIKTMFTQANAVFTEQLDRLINDYADTHPDFVADYKAKRKIVDPKTKSKPNGNGENNGGNTPA